jgi:hypothetical protein
MNDPEPDCEHARIVAMRLNHKLPKQDVVFCGDNHYTCKWVKKNLGCPKTKQAKER